MVQSKPQSTLFSFVTSLVMVLALGTSSCVLYEEAEPLDRALAVEDLELSPDPVRVELNKSRQVTATLYDRAEKPLEGLEVTWRSADETIATVDDEGMVQGLALGDTTITATVGQEEATATVVVFTPVKRIEVEPEEAFVDVGDRVDLTATVYGEDGEELVGSSVGWRSMDEDIATVDADGRVSGLAEGTATIRAAATGVTGSATVTVLEPIDRVELSPTEATIEVTDTVQLSADVFDVDGELLEDRPVTWSSSRPEVASVDSSGLVEGLEGGSAVVTAESGSKSAQATITVEAPVDELEVTPNPVSVEVSDSVQMTATAFDAAGNELSGVDLTWQVDDDTIATIDDDGLVVGRRGGEVVVTATSESESDTAIVTVEDPVAVVTISPATLSLNADETAQLTATLEDAAGNELDGRSVTWNTGDSDIARVDANGLVTARDQGVVDITATSEGVVGTAQVTVDNPVATVEISPSTPTVEVADTLQLTATAKDVRGNILSGHTITWSTSDPQAVSVDSSGLIEGLKGGSATITAQADNITGTADVTVDDPVRSVTVTPSTPTIEVTDTVQLAAALEDNAGNPLSGRTVTWSSSDDNIATVDSSGLVTAVAGGSVTITAESEGETGTAAVTVDNPVQSVDVSPDPGTVDVAQTLQLSATPRDQGGNALSGYTITWSSSDTSIATVDSSGLVTGEKGGSVTITAAADDGSGNTATGTADITVDDPVATVTVTPGSLFIFPNDQAQLDVTLEDANGNTLAGRTVTWSSQGTSVATVDSTGLVTGQSVGTTTITAESEGVTDTADLDVVEWVQVATGKDYSCGVISNNQGYCWGKNTDDGIIGDGSVDSGTKSAPNRDADKTSPARVAGGHSFASIEPGYFHTCGLTTLGEAYCWGYGGAGHLGQGSSNSSATPVAVSGGYTFAELGVGANHSCARTSGGDIYCWGANTLGQIGVGSSTQAFTVPQKISNFSADLVALGASHSCAIETSTGDTYCWGSNATGQLGDGTTNNQNAPVKVSTTEQFVDLSLGAEHSCGINATGEIFCWGSNAYSQLGDATTTDSSTPVRAASSSTYDQLAAGGFASCGITSAREVYCWGFNGQGNLGTGWFNSSESSPVRVSGSYSWDTVSLGFQHTCGLPAAPADSYCWGDNEYGQVGDGTDANDRSVVEQVLRP